MSIKKRKNNSKRDTWIVLGFLLLALVLIAGIVLLFALPQSAPEENPVPPTTASSSVPELRYEIPGFTMLTDAPCGAVNDRFFVACMGKYTGKFVEDGTDEQVTDVLAIVVENTGETLMEYGEITAQCGSDTATFAFSGLPAGSAVLVMEKNRLTYTDGVQLSALTCLTEAMPGNIVLDFGNDFSVYPSDGVINIENISGADIAGDVSVFYKNFAYGLFVGGITYRARFEGGIKNTEVKQTMQQHYALERSAILYMSYEH